MTETPTPKKVRASLYKPPTERPEETKISLTDYIEDVTIRWQIHLYEWDEFSKDVVNASKTLYGWSLVGIERVKEAYNKMGEEKPEQGTDKEV